MVLDVGAEDLVCCLHPRRVQRVADLDQGYQGTADYRWILQTRGGQKDSPFLLTDQTTRKEVKSDSIAEILKVLEEARL